MFIDTYVVTQSQNNSRLISDAIKNSVEVSKPSTSQAQSQEIDKNPVKSDKIPVKTNENSEENVKNQLKVDNIPAQKRCFSYSSLYHVSVTYLTGMNT